MSININDENDNPRVGAMLDNNGSFTQYGITLRDHFAGLAMQGLTANKDNGYYTEDEYIAKRAYSIADSMLKARKEVKP